MSNSFDPMDCHLPGFSFHGNFHARILEMGSHSLLQGIFWIQGLNLGLFLAFQADSLPSEPQDNHPFELWCWRIDAFELWCWRRLLRVPWTTRRSNQLFLKEINPEYSLEGLMLKVKLQYFDHLMQWADSLEKTLMLGKIEGKRRRGWQRMR